MHSGCTFDAFGVFSVVNRMQMAVGRQYGREPPYYFVAITRHEASL